MVPVLVRQTWLGVRHIRLQEQDGAEDPTGRAGTTANIHWLRCCTAVRAPHHSRCGTHKGRTLRAPAPLPSCLSHSPLPIYTSRIAPRKPISPAARTRGRSRRPPRPRAPPGVRRWARPPATPPPARPPPAAAAPAVCPDRPAPAGRAVGAMAVVGGGVWWCVCGGLQGCLEHTCGPGSYMHRLAAMPRRSPAAPIHRQLLLTALPSSLLGLFIPDALPA